MTRSLGVVLGVFLLGTGPLWGFPLPPALETRHLLGKGTSAGVPPVPLTDELYALGWSRDHAFAVLERRTLGPSQKEVRFRVYDLVEDTVLLELTWPDWETDSNQGPWWDSHGPEVDRAFTRFGLEPSQFQMGVFPLILDEDFDSLAVRPGRAPDSPGWFDRLEIVVNSAQRGLKTVRDVRGFWRWAVPLGFVPSPFEPRVALILLVQPAGWQGTEEPLRYLVVGTSLKAGFSAP